MPRAAIVAAAVAVAVVVVAAGIAVAAVETAAGRLVAVAAASVVAGECEKSLAEHSP